MATFKLTTYAARPNTDGSFAIELNISRKPAPFPARIIEARTTADAIEALAAYGRDVAAAVEAPAAVSISLAKGSRAPAGFRALTSRDTLRPANFGVAQ